MPLGLLPLLLVGCKPTEEKSSSVQSGNLDKGVAVEPDDPVPFGYKCAWLAIQSEDPAAVVDALKLLQVRKCSWKLGIEAAYQHEVFVGPPVRGWVLVASSSLPDISEKGREDRLSSLVRALGKDFPEVQYFGTHRVVEYHGWLRATKGEIVRRYDHLGERGETLCNEGNLTA